MSGDERIRAIALKVAAVRDALDALEKSGLGIPAVEKNAARMKGTLRQLEVQFSFPEYADRKTVEAPGHQTLDEGETA